MTTPFLPIAGQTDVGRSRKDNQDTFVCRPLWSNKDALLLVIDGVGGYAGGAEAAALAKESIVQYMAAPTGDTLTMLREAVVHANNQIVKQRQQNPALARMCCVLTVAVADVEARKLLFVHVGDTRLYRFRASQLEKITHDHSLVGIREDADQLTEREAMTHPRRNEILRDVGSIPHRLDDPDFLEWGETDFLPGDGLLLCSDGLTDMLTRAQVTDVLTQPLLAEEQIAELIRQANEQGGHDNITIVLAQYPVEMKTVNGLPDETLTPNPVRAEPTTALKPADSTVVTGTTVAPLTGENVKSGSTSLRWLGMLMLFIVILLAVAIAWWQTKAPPHTVPATVVQPAPVLKDSIQFIPTDSVRSVSADSLIELTVKKQPNLTKKP